MDKLFPKKCFHEEGKKREEKKLVLFCKIAERKVFNFVKFLKFCNACMCVRYTIVCHVLEKMEAVFIRGA